MSIRLNKIVAKMKKLNVETLIAFSNSIHSFLEPNPIHLISGVKNIGESMVLLRADGSSRLIVTPSWDVHRAAQLSRTNETIGTDDLFGMIKELVKSESLHSKKVGMVGIAEQSNGFFNSVNDLFEGRFQLLDSMFYELASQKSEEEIVFAKKAAWIAERGYEKLLEVAKPGIYEYQLAGEIDCIMKGLGADDDFLLMSASQHNQAVRPPSRRILEKGDIILAEISPSYMGQFVQICRTAVIGEASPTLVDKYQLVKTAMQQGMEAAVPGAKMSDVVKALNKPLELEGYGEYCRPPYMRVRGHGLGLSSLLPGEVTEYNDTVLEAGMVFVLHPNQYIPETGYLLCGEPVLITSMGAIALTERLAELDTVPE